jgi:hypothetical protein
MPPKNSKRHVDKLLRKTLTQRVVPHHTTTTRHRFAASGQTTKEVPRKRDLNAEKKVVVEPLLDAPIEETAVGVEPDGMEDPADKVHDPSKLAEEHTQVSHRLYLLFGA